MKTVYVLWFLFLCSLSIQAQSFLTLDKKISSRQSPWEKHQLHKIHSMNHQGNHLVVASSGDTIEKNARTELLNDDPEYNIKYPFWKPAVAVLANNLLTFSFDRYVLKYDWAMSVSAESWKHNFKTGWEWDTDRFGMNFFDHPYTGSLYFNNGRAMGYNYYESFGFAVEGSIMWEYLCENTLPSYSDIVMTTTTGAFLGEVLYRISSNILDDQTRGTERTFREILAGVVDPMRGIHRLLQGKSRRVTTKEVYQKELLNVSFYAGMHRVNEEGKLMTGPISGVMGFEFDYGNPFEMIARKPFDLFNLRAEFASGEGRKLLSMVNGYGILFGKNYESKSKKRDILIGVFQNYDYWDNRTFELATLGFGAGIMSKLRLPRNSSIHYRINLGIVPMAGNSTHMGPDTSQFRDFNYGGGLQGKLEASFNIDKYGYASFAGYYYWIHTYVGFPGENFIGIIKPRVTIQLFKSLSIGFEHTVYYNDRYQKELNSVHFVRTDQKVFLFFHFVDDVLRHHYD